MSPKRQKVTVAVWNLGSLSCTLRSLMQSAQLETGISARPTPFVVKQTVCFGSFQFNLMAALLPNNQLVFGSLCSLLLPDKRQEQIYSWESCKTEFFTTFFTPLKVLCFVPMDSFEPALVDSNDIKLPVLNLRVPEWDVICLWATTVINATIHKITSH